MTQIPNRKFDLEERTKNFAKKIIRILKNIESSPINSRLMSQVIASAGSVGANYREANEALSKKDFIYRMRISRKECKETTFWLELILETNTEFEFQIEEMIKESREIRNIFSAIIQKSLSK